MTASAMSRPAVRRWSAGLAATALLLLPATAASARGSGWTPWQPPVGIVVACGSTPVDLSFPYSKEYVRELPLRPGTVDIQQFTGSLTIQFSTADRSVRLNTGGPGLTITYANGDVETRSSGHYSFAVSPDQAAQLGLPQIFGTTGLIDFVTHPDGSMTPVRIPSTATDVCAELGL
ncbi:hypothetical protein ACFUC1_00385 [Pedococcus sp. NPDC057267]|uniref:hypothetical protein n=1 Tax=Pedococcus sp. NPDC057267 TaxID=3346077 RepID=UPI00363448DE